MCEKRRRRLEEAASLSASASVRALESTGDAACVGTSSAITTDLQCRCTIEIEARETGKRAELIAKLVAKGEVELGMTVITQILTTPGVDLVGPLPPEIQSHITFVAGVGSRSRAPKAARELIAFLRGPMARATIRAQGMEPR